MVLTKWFILVFVKGPSSFVQAKAAENEKIIYRD